MTEFEFIFVLYALVLGLSVVELLSGFGASLEKLFRSEADDVRFRIGWLTPLFAIFVMLDLMSFWVFAWVVRDLISLTPGTLLGILAFASAYYLAARLVFPTDPADFHDLDTHYFRVRRTVIGILIALVFVQWAFLMTIPAFREVILRPYSIATTVVLLVLMGAAMWLKSVRGNAIILALLIARYLVVYLA
ncbi:hypothetical protein [Pseudoblastomonas halimionae]|uniref:Uncharacterized protein n=1 Tax=Alteriqipengyuania halimionae TaxID=1926630 RepID=A0A6I4U4T5_9SPHN|nr:hypothetical protein [Alteriqipengyuania halimionae]MXP09462.1 hypothetical protein [Alteriqipengyuania halimionae]